MPLNKLTIRELNIQIPETIDDKTRTVRATIATENPVQVYDYQRGVINEVLVMDGMQQNEKMIPLVDSHNYSTTANIKGSVLNIKALNGDLTGDVQFSSVSNDEWTKVKEGHIRKLSIGYSVNESTFIPANENFVYNGRTFSGGDSGVKLSTNWSLFECSLVTIPADSETNFRNKLTETENNLSGVNSMDKAVEKEVKSTEPVIETRAKIETPSINVEAERAAAVTAERARISEIRNAGRALNIDDGEIDSAIDKGNSADECRKVFISRAAESMKHVDNVRVTMDSADKRMAALEDSLCVARNVGTNEQKKSVKTSEYRTVTGLQALARTCLVENGDRSAYRYSNAEVSNRILGRANAQSTSDFTNVLSNVQNKVINFAWDQEVQTYQAWLPAFKPMTDFKSGRIISLSGISDLELTPEGKPPSYGVMSDKSETVQLGIYSKAFSLSFQALTNDDLGMFDVPAAFARAGQRKINKMVYSTLSGSGTMSDGNTLFCPAHNNYTGSGTAISVTSLGVGRATLQKQTVVTGDTTIPLNYQPQFLVVSPDKLTLAQQIVNSSFLGVNTDINTVMANPFAGVLRIISDANLTGNQWYLAAAPDLHGIAVYTLDGTNAPVIRMANNLPGTSYGLTWDVMFPFVVGVGDWRGVYANAGA